MSSAERLPFGGEDDRLHRSIRSDVIQRLLERGHQLGRQGIAGRRAIQRQGANPTVDIPKEGLPRIDRWRGRAQSSLLVPDGREIAARLGRTEEAVRQILSRGLKALRQRFGDTESLHLPDRDFAGGMIDEPE